MDPLVLFFLGMIVFLAFLMKAMTGFGPAIVIITFGSLFFHPHDLIPLSSMLDCIAGLILFIHQFHKEGWRYWLPMTLSIMVGAILGGYMLKQVDVQIMKFILAASILILGLWFVVADPSKRKHSLSSKLPDRINASALSVSLFAGWLGGFIGISGPPLVWYAGRKFEKVAFRQVLIPIFLGAALMRVVTYASVGLIHQANIMYAATSLPFLLVGLYVGNHIFYKLSEKIFKQVVGGVLICMAVRMLVVYFI